MRRTLLGYSLKIIGGNVGIIKTRKNRSLKRKIDFNTILIFWMLFWGVLVIVREFIKK